MWIRTKRVMPHCLIVEAGIATGPPKVLFLGKTLDAAIDQFSGYKPTPFSCSDNAYNGLHVEGDSPKQLNIKARKILGGVSQPHYIIYVQRYTRDQQRGLPRAAAARRLITDHTARATTKENSGIHGSAGKNGTPIAYASAETAFQCFMMFEAPALKYRL